MPVKQELFESVRAVISGRIRDQEQVREIAYRVAEESTSLRRRVERAVGYARRGLRLEACAEAEAEPSVHELAVAFGSEPMRQWRSVCARNKLPVPDEVPAEALGEIDEAIAFTAPLRKWLSHMRVLVLQDAPAWSRLEVLRKLVARDPDNPAWQEDLRALEPRAVEELAEEFGDAIREGRVSEAAQCVQRLEDGQWRTSSAARAASDLRGRLHRAEAEHGTAELSGLIARLESEWGAGSEPGVRAGIQAIRAVEERLASAGAGLPAAVAARLGEVERWLAEREEHAESLREGQERIDELDRMVQDDSSGLAALRSALRAAEQSLEGVPDDLRASAEARIGALERVRRIRRASVVAAVVVALVGIAFASYLLVERSAKDQQLEAGARSVLELLEKGDLKGAEQGLRSLEDLAGPGDPALAEARSAVGTAQAERKSRKEEFDKLLASADGKHGDDRAREQVERARRLAVDADQHEQVEGWLARHEETRENASRNRIKELQARARAILDTIKRERERDREDPGLLATISQQEKSLKELRNDWGPGAEGDTEYGKAWNELSRFQAEVNQARIKADRDGAIKALASSASTPESLADALEAFAARFPGEAESGAFRDAAAARPLWDSVLEWSALSGRVTPALAAASDAQRSEASKSVEQYAGRHPSPFGAQCDAVRALLVPVTGWKDALEKALAERVEFGCWVIERDDGTRWFCRRDPSVVQWSRNPQGQESKSVLVLKAAPGSSKAESYEEFLKSSVRYEGPSPQMRLRDELRKVVGRVADGELDGLGGLLAVLDALCKSADVDGAMVSVLAKTALDGAIVPDVLRAKVSDAARRIGREQPENIAWYLPVAPEARKSSAGAAKVLREAVQVDAWRSAYEQALRSAVAPFATTYRIAGVLLEDPPGKGMAGVRRRLARVPGNVHGGSSLVVVVPDLAGMPSRLVGLEVSTAADAEVLGPSAAAVPAGSMVFEAVTGGSR